MKQHINDSLKCVLKFLQPLDAIIESRNRELKILKSETYSGRRIRELFCIQLCLKLIEIASQNCQNISPIFCLHSFVENNLGFYLVESLGRFGVCRWVISGSSDDHASFDFWAGSSYVH